MSDFKYSIAKSKHDPSLRRLLRQNPMVGSISLAFESEPSYFAGVLVGNESNRTIICEDTEINKVIALLSISEKKVYINGIVKKIGYLNNLRVDKEYRGQGIISNAWEVFYNEHKKGDVPYYITSIIKDNYKAKQALLKEKKGRPTFIKIGDYTTFIISLFRRKNWRSKVVVRKATKNDIDDIVMCLKRNGKKRQFYPSYTKNIFVGPNKLLGLEIENFFIAKHKGKIIGVACVWDQKRFKQTVIAGYHNSMKVFRFFYNKYARFFSFPVLPETGETVKYVYIACIAIDDNNVNVFRDLIYTIHNGLVGKEYLYMTIGFFDNDPLSRVAKEFFSIKYKSEIYMATYNKDEIFDITAKGIPHIELATL